MSVTSALASTNRDAQFGSVVPSLVFSDERVDVSETARLWAVTASAQQVFGEPVPSGLRGQLERLAVVDIEVAAGD